MERGEAGAEWHTVEVHSARSQRFSEEAEGLETDENGDH